MILLEHVSAHFQSAAEQFAPDDLKTEHNSLVGNELNLVKKMTC
jgi:hypothetical protein